MRASRFQSVLTSAVAAVVGVCAVSSFAAASNAPTTLFFDASFSHLRTAGPDSSHVGHQQIGSGPLRSATGHVLGQFAFTCTWTRILPGGVARERCVGAAHTVDGRIEVAGPSRQSDAAHTWRITGGTGAYRGATGTVLVRDLTPRESVIAVTTTAAAGTTLRAGVIPRPRANASLIARADRLCTAASRRLDALPPFPFRNFDPLHPDPSVLRQVGAFFTGRGDPRPILRDLDRQLDALPTPPARRDFWKRLLDARGAEAAVRDEQDAAALAGNVPAFVKSLGDTNRSFRQVAITATVFGATACVI